MDHSTPGLPVHHQLPEFTQTPVHRVGDAIPPISSSVAPVSSRPQSCPAGIPFRKLGVFPPAPPSPPPRLHTSTFFPLPCPPSYSGTNAVSRRLRVELRKWTGGGEGSVLHSGEEAALCILIRCRLSSWLWGFPPVVRLPLSMAVGACRVGSIPAGNRATQA